MSDLATLRRRGRAWRNIALSATMRRVDPGWIPRPHAGHLIVTFRCNLQCTGCGSWKVRDHADLSLEEWRRVLRQLDSLDLVKVLGGEPFVRKDIVPLLESVRELVDPYILQLTTNGMLTRRVIDALEAIAWPGLQLRISVDGRPETHDRMRGVSGSWAKVNETCEQVARLRERKDFQFGINFAVNDESIDELQHMMDYAEGLGADLIPGLSVDPFLVGTVPPEVRPQKIIFLEDKERALRVWRETRAGLKEQLPLLDRLLSRVLVRDTFSQQLTKESQHFTCRELRDLLYLLPNGDVVRCGLDHRPVGNLRRDRFDDVWFGSYAREFRQRVDDCAGCMQASVQILSRLYGGCLLD